MKKMEVKTPCANTLEEGTAVMYDGKTFFDGQKIIDAPWLQVAIKAGWVIEKEDEWEDIYRVCPEHVFEDLLIDQQIANALRYEEELARCADVLLREVWTPPQSYTHGPTVNLKDRRRQQIESLKKHLG